MKLLSRIEKTKACWFLIATFFFFFLLRLPSLFEPYWYGDEGIYQIIGIAMQEGRQLYSGIWDNKPPLLYMLYTFFSSDQFMLRLVSLVFGILSVSVFYMLIKKLFFTARFFTTGLFALLFGTPLLEGNIANSENFMLFPIILAGVLIYSAASNPSDKKLSLFKSQLSIVNCQLFLSGFLLSLAFLLKVVAIFDFVAFLFFLIIVTIPSRLSVKKIRNSTLLKNVLFFGVSFLLPILFTTLFFFSRGVFSDFIGATLQQNVGYVGYGNRLLVPQGFLLLKLLILTLAIYIFFLKRKLFTTQQLFIFLWFGFSLFNAFFSQRPYTHYLLTLLPSFCLMVGLMLSDKKYERSIAISLLVTLFVILTSFTLYGKTFSYYHNFIAFVTNQKSVIEYQSFFDRNTPQDYAVATFLKTHTMRGDAVFIWGNSAQTYVLSNKLPPGRYTVAYHITSSVSALKETQRTLLRVKPKYIVVYPGQTSIPFNLSEYTQKIAIYDRLIYERIY